jgi:integrase
MAARRDKTGRWRYRKVVRLPDGSKVRISGCPTINTRDACETEERAHIKRVLDPNARHKEVPTLRKFSREFMTTYVQSNNKPSERASKQYILDKHLLVGVLADRRLDEIGTREFEAIKARLLAMKKRPKTINNVLAVLSKLLHYAAEVGHIDKAPRVKLLRVPPQSFDFLGDEESAALRAGTVSDPDLHASILVAADAGLRRGEILGLHWEDVDLRSRRLTVRRSLWAGELTSPKGGRERTIPMTERLAKALGRIRHLRGPFVFCREDGSHWTWEVMRAALPRACKLGGIRTVRWHALRHTFCTHLAMRGAPAKAIQEAAGHVSLTTTLKYMHLAPRVLDDAIGLLEKDVAWQTRGKETTKAANPS